MDIYTYVASSNPYQAKSILHKYGYSAKDVKNEKDLGICLKKLVSYEGEDAFIDILDSHPDKAVLIERYVSQNSKPQYKNADGCDCGCKECGDSKNKKKSDSEYSNLSGDNKDKKALTEVSIYIIAASLLLAAAIISKK
jgi:hypothetical protein